MIATQTTAPISMSVVVPLPQDQAFHLFTDRMESWWPTRTHSIAEDKVTGVVFEGRAGGEIYEVCSDGSRNHWAEILEWEPPHRFVMAWKPNPKRTAPTEVEIAFTAEAGGTRVAIEHRGWERLGEGGPAARADYASEGGWTLVIGLFEKAAS